MLLTSWSSLRLKKELTLTRSPEVNVVVMRIRQFVIITSLSFALFLFFLSFFPSNIANLRMDQHTNASIVVDLPTSAISDTLKFFGYDSTDVGVISWAHAVNSKREFLEAKLAGMNFFEADILLRKEANNDDVPIMAHPPATDSDLTLREFLHMSSSLPIGVKLDFKTIEALRASVAELLEHGRRAEAVSGRAPFWMNADIVGHGAVVEGKVDADEFLNTSRHVTPLATLSIGWNIAPSYFLSSPNVVSPSSSSPTSPSPPLSYSDDDVRRMRDALERNGFSPETSITFAIWSKFISNSLDTLQWLTDHYPNSSVTIWGKADDATVEQVAAIYSVLPKSRVFLDLPETLKREIMQTS